MALMIEELDQLNRRLERLVEERTAALREREAELQAQNLRFHTALNHMSPALLMYDAAGRLVVCNHRFHEMYSLSPEVAKPGCSIYDLLTQRKANGTFVGDIDSYAADLQGRFAQGETVRRLVELPDGRTIAILGRPMPGGGWVP